MLIQSSFQEFCYAVLCPIIKLLEKQQQAFRTGSKSEFVVEFLAENFMLSGIYFHFFAL